MADSDALKVLPEGGMMIFCKGQIYLMKDDPPPEARWKSFWFILLITKIKKAQRTYIPIEYETIAYSEPPKSELLRVWDPPVPYNRKNWFGSNSPFSQTLKALDKKDLPLYMDGRVTKKFEQIMKGVDNT